MPDINRYNHERLPGGAVLLSRPDANSPEGSTVGNTGDLLTGKGAGARAWVKDSGEGTNTGWAALAELDELTVGMMSPPIGAWENADNVCTLAGVAMSSTTSGVGSFQPFRVGPKPERVDALAYTVSTAGATTTNAQRLLLGIYRSNADRTGPDLAFGPVASVTVDGATASNFTSTGFKSVTLGASVLLSMGLYWTFSLWHQTAAPGTYPQMLCLNTCIMIPWTFTPNTSSLINRGLRVTGLTGFPTSGTPSTATDASLVNVFVRRIAT